MKRRTFASASLALAFAFVSPVSAQDAKASSIVMLCNESTLPMTARYKLQLPNGVSQQDQQLPPVSGRPYDPATCFPLRITGYAGPINVSGQIGHLQFVETTLTVPSGSPTYVWYDVDGSCAKRRVSGACLAIAS